MPFSHKTQHLIPAVQYAECVYLVCRGQIIFPILIALLSLGALVGLAVTVSKQHKAMKKLINQRHIVPVVQSGWVRALASWRLVPGDVIVLQHGKAACDMVRCKMFGKHHSC